MEPCTPKKGRDWRKSDRREYATPKRASLLTALRTRSSKTKKAVYEEEGVPSPTARRWQKHEREVGFDAAVRRKGKERPSLPCRIPDSILDSILSIRNPVRNRNYECQLEHFDIQAHPETARKSQKLRRKAKLFKRAKALKVSEKNERIREEYGFEHKTKTVEPDSEEPFWCFILWTDEAHIDGSVVSGGRILRKEGDRYAPENIAQIPPLEGVSLHIRASCSWF